MSADLSLVLASQSPRRREILSHAGILFSVRVPDVEEIRRPGEGPQDYVRRLAREKAQSVECGPREVILGADTVVVIDEEILEKPHDDADAWRMLGLLSGRAHRVFTGICLRSVEHQIEDCAATRVRFAPLSEAEIDAYVASGEPTGKAGAYAIQGLASKFVAEVSGCYFNIVGLPVALVYRRLREF